MGLLTRGTWLVGLVACCMAGCVIVPYKPGAEVVETLDVPLDPANIMVTLGPRRLVEEVTEAIIDADKDIRVVSAVDFLDVAIPGDDLTLQGLLTSGSAQRARSQLGADYLVLVGERKEYTTDEFGGMIPYMGFYGLYKEKEHTTLLSTIVDLANARPMADVSAHAQGTSAGAGAFYGLFLVPMTDSSARDGLARGLVASLRHAAGRGPLAIAVAAGERISEDEPSCSGEEAEGEGCAGINPTLDALIETQEAGHGEDAAPLPNLDNAAATDPPIPTADPSAASPGPT